MNFFLLGKTILKDVCGHHCTIKTREEHMHAAMNWLCLAQDIQNDGGVSLRYSLIDGWEKAYPETTGYIIPTFIEYASFTENKELSRIRKFRD